MSLSRQSNTRQNYNYNPSRDDDDYGDILDQVLPEPINLVDHTENGGTDNSNSNNNTVDIDNLPNNIWARNVVIDQYEVIRGSTKAGAYVVYLIRIETYLGDSININRRYSEFWTFRERLCARFPSRLNEIPHLPPKSFIAKFRPKFLAHRQAKLQYFLLCILLNPVFCSSQEAKEFVKE